MVCRSVMKEMIFIAAPQRGQTRGSTSQNDIPNIRTLFENDLRVLQQF
jgi:phenylalanyl-tRNA synthetase alpha subunit